MKLDDLLDYSPYTGASAIVIDGVLQLPLWREALQRIPRGALLPATAYYPPRHVIGRRHGRIYTTCLGADGLPVSHPERSYRIANLDRQGYYWRRDGRGNWESLRSGSYSTYSSRHHAERAARWLARIYRVAVEEDLQVALA